MAAKLMYPASVKDFELVIVQLAKVEKEAESVLAEKKKRIDSNNDNVSPLASFGLKDMYDKLVSDLEQGPVTYTFDAKITPTKE